MSRGVHERARMQPAHREMRLAESDPDGVEEIWMSYRPDGDRGDDTNADVHSGGADAREPGLGEILAAACLMAILLALMYLIANPESLKLSKSLGPANLTGLEPDRYPAWCG